MHVSTCYMKHCLAESERLKQLFSVAAVSLKVETVPLWCYCESFTVLVRGSIHVFSCMAEFRRLIGASLVPL